MMTAQQQVQQRVLPADVYDVMELSALAYGGIGAGAYYTKGKVPMCGIGQARAADSGTPWDGDVERAVRRTGINGVENDLAVRTINERKGKGRSKARVSFEEWAAELGVVRGD